MFLVIIVYYFPFVVGDERVMVVVRVVKGWDADVELRVVVVEGYRGGDGASGLWW